jgi:hypothetical protein
LDGEQLATKVTRQNKKENLKGEKREEKVCD